MISRREFILSGASTVAWAALRAPAWASGDPGSSQIIFGSRYSADKKKFFVGVLNPRDNKLIEIPVSFKGHGFAVHPQRPERVIMFGHIPSPVSAEVDVVKGVLIREIRTQSGRYFYGHGVISPDGRQILSAESDDKSAHGTVVIRDYDTLKVVGDFPTFGFDPHDMDYCEKGKTLLVANGGLKVQLDSSGNEVMTGAVDSSLAWIDAKKQTLIKKAELENKTLSLRHFCRLPNEQYAVIIQEKTLEHGPGGLLVLIDKNKHLQLKGTDPKLREQLRFHTLSTDYLKDDLMAVTSPNGGQLTIWNSRAGRLVKALDVPKVSGVATYEKGKRALLSLNDGGLMILNTNSLSVEKSKIKLDKGFKWGAHLGSTFV